jgi:hypothetical protein
MIEIDPSISTEAVRLMYISSPIERFKRPFLKWRSACKIEVLKTLPRNHPAKLNSRESRKDTMASFFKLLHSPDVSRRRRRFNPHRFFHQVKFYAIESAANPCATGVASKGGQAAAGIVTSTAWVGAGRSSEESSGMCSVHGTRSQGSHFSKESLDARIA